MEGTVGEIRIFPGNFAPAHWALCQGQILPISEYEVLYTLIGTTYGGDGQSSFGVPNLSGRVGIGTGQGAGLSNYTLGETLGVSANTLTAAQLPSHTHALTGTAGILVHNEDGHKVSPVNNSPAVNGDMIYSRVADSSLMAPATMNLAIGSVGNPAPEPVNNIKPTLAINYIICFEGIFPTRP